VVKNSIPPMAKKERPRGSPTQREVDRHYNVTKTGFAGIKGKAGSAPGLRKLRLGVDRELPV